MHTNIQKKFILITVLIFFVHTYFWAKTADIDLSKLKIETFQAEKNSSQVFISVENAAGAEHAVISGYAVNGKNRYLKFSDEINIINGKGNKLFDTHLFGKYSIELIFKNTAVQKKYVHSEALKIIADEYTINIQNSTFPVLLFTLDMLSQEKTVPTFIALERPSAYNWEKLPPFMHLTPTLNPATVNSSNTFFTEAIPATVEFLKQLKEISPNAKINLIITDIFPELILQCLYANGWTQENTHITMYSDGSATYVYAKMPLENEENYNQLKLKWDNTKANAFSGKYEFPEYTKNADLSALAPCAAIIASEKNVTWKIGRKSLLVSNEKALQEKVQKNAVQISMSDMLKNLSDNKKSMLKDIYNFNSEMFENADKKNKKIIIFLGTRDDADEKFALKEYLNIMKTLYKDDYEYYYKGHPGDPSLPDHPRKKILQDTGFHELDASIPAELVLFYKPQVYLCGYPSTTFAAADSDHVLTVFSYDNNTENPLEKTKELSALYREKVKSYVYKINGKVEIHYVK